MTLATDAGFEVGGMYTITRPNSGLYEAGDRMKFTIDDGSDLPGFKNMTRETGFRNVYPCLRDFYEPGQTKLTEEQKRMAWTEIEGFKIGDTVRGKYGEGKVVKVHSNGKVEYLTDRGPFAYTQEEGEVIQRIEGDLPATDDKVEFTQEDIGKAVAAKNGTKTGTIVDVNSRNVRVEWFNGQKESINKKEAHNHIEKIDAQTEEKAEEKPVEQKTTEMADSMFALFEVERKVNEKIETKVEEGLKDLKELAESHRTLEIKKGDNIRKIEGTKHKQLEQLIEYAAARLNPLLVGMAGTGKTHAAEQASDALGLRFFSISVGAQTTKTDIMGYMSATGDYISTHFRDAYENGGIFLMDEIDAGNANVLITINAALSNGIAAFPDAMVKKHEDFIFIASANTFGNGANRQYVGRNQLDAATLDRFAVIEWLIDDDLEKSLAHGDKGNAWYNAVKETRKYVADHSIRALISPRATQKGSLLISLGKSAEEAANATLLSSVPEDKKPDVLRIALEAFNKTPKGKAQPAKAPKKSSEGVTQFGGINLGSIHFS